jgi:hypothetical protein
VANAESKKLTVDVIARIDRLEKGMAKASSVANTQMSKIESRAKLMDSRLGKVGANAFLGITKGALAAAASAITVGAAINGAKAALQEFGDIYDRAKTAGLSPETFQELAHQASLGGVAFGEFAKALETFSKNSGLAEEGKGRMLTTLKALNPELLKNILATTDQATRVRLAADAIASAGSASQKAALSTALYGDAGALLADVFTDGAKGIDAAAASARAMGLIIDGQLINRAEEMGDQFEVATRVLDLQFKKALVDLAPLLTGTATLAGNVASAIGQIVDAMRDLDDQSADRLEGRMRTIGAERLQLENDILKMQDDARNNTGFGGLFAGLGNKDAIAAKQAQSDALGKESAQIAGILSSRQVVPPPATPPILPDNGGGGSTGDDAAKAAIRHGEAVKALIADLTFEKQIIGETALEQQILNTLRNAGVDAASAEGQAIRGLVTDLDAQKTALQANADAMAEFSDLAHDALSTFANDLLEGKNAAESLGNVMKNLTSQFLNMGISALTGGLFGGGGGGFKLFADGGATGPAGFNNIEVFQ